MNKTIITVLAAMAISMQAMAVDETADIPAFPGAEGFGMYTTGGRGGAVYHVTSLEDTNDEGTFRWACNQSGQRTIVFDVSGTIMLTSELKLRNGNVTIAGQTAPGDGICVANFPFVISAPNVIIRYMRFRLGNEALKTNKSAHEGDGLGGMDSRNIVIDHCSVSWSIDECLSVYGSRNITVQWSYITHSLLNAGHSKGNHGYGGNWGGAGASYHHNLLAHHASRTPRLGPRPGTQTDERMDLRNNVIYNFGGNGCYGGEGMNVNIVNNYYKPGPTSPTGSKGKRIAAPGIRTVDYCLDKTTIQQYFYKATGTAVASSQISGGRDVNNGNYVTIKGTRYYIDMDKNTIDVTDANGNPAKCTVAWNSWKPMLHTWGQLYVTGNVNPVYDDLTADNWTKGIYDQIDKSGNDRTFTDETNAWMKLSSPIAFLPTTTHTAEKAFELVTNYAGASLHRDEYDAFIAQETKEGTALFGSKGIINSQDDITYADGHAGWPTLESEPAAADTDGDGMPDEWESANGLDPLSAEDGPAVSSNGYTNLENYLNSLVAHITEAQNKGGNVESAGINDIFVDNVAGTVKDGRTYNILGQPVSGNLAPGIYIRDGKKFIVK